MQTRDPHLDFLRGSAIILVVVGHYLQAQPDFDLIPIFRLIYAFHMPLFMLICGLTAAHSVRRQLASASATNELATSLAKSLLHKATRLLLPFLTWACIAYCVTGWHTHATPMEYGKALIVRPDNALWFLPVLFCLHAAATFAQLIHSLVLRSAPHRAGLPLLSACLLVAWTSLLVPYKWHLMKLACYYYPFFCAGLMVALFPPQRLSRGVTRALGLVALTGFFCLMPFWQRTGLDPRLAGLFSAHYAGMTKPTLLAITAICGSASFILLASEVKPFEHHWLARGTQYLGTRTLAIYAIHLFFLGFLPGLVAIPFAIAASLGLDMLLRQVGWSRWLLLGERQAPDRTWRELLSGRGHT